jgi:hypothetical protein
LNPHEIVPSDAIARLLSEADEQEAILQHNDRATVFDTVLQGIVADIQPQQHAIDGPTTRPDTAPILNDIDGVLMESIPAATRKPERFEVPRRPAPKLTVSPGDLVVVFGLRDDALAVARAMAVATPTIEVAVGGDIGKPGSRHVGDRREALQARADGVRRNGSTLVAIGLGEAPSDAARYAGILHDVVPDQVWIAVDVTRKPEDTRVWAQLVAEAGGGIDAIGAIGTAYTTTPDSTAYLGIPVGWADGRLPARGIV